MKRTTPKPNVPAGWYPDPDANGTQRFWDGEEWTEQRAPLVEKEEVDPDRTFGVLLALAIPAVGFFYGLWLLGWRNGTSGALTILASFVGAFFWVMFLIAVGAFATAP